MLRRLHSDTHCDANTRADTDGGARAGCAITVASFYSRSAGESIPSSYSAAATEPDATS